MSSTAGEETKYNSGILLTSCLLHSFIQGIVVSQVGRYYEDYYHLDTLSMKLYVGSIVVVSLYVCRLQHPNRNSRAYPGNRSAQTTYISYNAWVIILLQGGHSPTVACALSGSSAFSNTGLGTVESIDIGGFVPERHTLHPLPYIPHQTMLESK